MDYSEDLNSNNLSKYISIKQKKNKIITDVNNFIDEYSLTQNLFDPNKSSPPSEWSYRLKSRLQR